MTEIRLDGVSNNQKAIAEEEIKSLLDNFFSENENPVALIWIAKSFREAICSFHGNSSYTPSHEYGTAAAKTMSMLNDGKLVFTLVFDGNVFGKWEKEKRIFRTSLLSHEFVHVADGYRQWLEEGTDKFFAKPVRYQESLLHNAWILWEEFDACRLVMEVLGKVAKEFGGKVHDDLSVGNAETLYTMLKDIRHFIDQRIRDYRLSELTLDQLQYQITSKVLWILILWAYTIPSVDIVDEVKAKM